MDLATIESQVVATIVDIRQNAGVAGPECILATDYMACMDKMYSCQEITPGGEGIPVLP